MDLRKAGVYKYAESDDFKVLLFAYSVDGNDIKVIDLAKGENIPKGILAALIDENIENGHLTHNLKGYVYQGIYGTGR